MTNTAVLPGSTSLLVSVRNVDEAHAALTGGCDILDAKEPNRGSLGMADVETIANVIALAGQSNRMEDADTPGAAKSVPVSAALGEVLDWRDPRGIPVLPPGLKYAKLGMTGLDTHRDGFALWRNVRDEFDARTSEPIRWVAVAYADWKESQAPSPEAVIDAAAETGCSVVLFDTWKKCGKSLLDWILLEQLQLHIGRIQRHGMKAAIAGSLGVKLLPEVVNLQPDLVAVRGAVCEGRDRTARVCELKVREFKREMTARIPHRITAPTAP